MRLWTVDNQDLLALACSHTTRNLSQPEWNTYLGRDVPYYQTCPNLPIHTSVALEYARQGKIDLDERIM